MNVVVQNLVVSLAKIDLGHPWGKHVIKWPFHAHLYCIVGGPQLLVFLILEFVGFFSAESAAHDDFAVGGVEAHFGGV